MSSASAGLFTLEEVLEVPLVRRCWDEVRARYPDLPVERLTGELVRHQIGVMVNNLLAETRLVHMDYLCTWIGRPV